MRITLVISSLECGGAQRVMSTMAGYWAARGREITLVTLDSAGSDFYRPPSTIRRLELRTMPVYANPWDSVLNNLGRLKNLRRAIRRSKPDAVVSFMDKVNVMTLLATRGLRLKVVVSERVDPSQTELGWPWSRLRLLLYPHADTLVAQSANVGQWLKRISGSRPVVVIPNPLPFLNDEAGGDTSRKPLDGGHPSESTVVAMGRLEHQKGFDLLLKAFARVAPAHPDWRLVILGEGEERVALTELACELGIAPRVFLPGMMENPFPILRRAGLFVLSSRYEGFPNALLEAMACGLPVISSDCPSGPAEIVRDGVDGILVPPEDVDALAAAMGRLMADENERMRLASRAAEVAERFGQDKVMGMWEEVLQRLCVK